MMGLLFRVLGSDAMFTLMLISLAVFLVCFRGMYREHTSEWMRARHGFDRQEAHTKSLRQVVGRVARATDATDACIRATGVTAKAKRDHLHLVSDDEIEDVFLSDAKVKTICQLHPTKSRHNQNAVSKS